MQALQSSPASIVPVGIIVSAGVAMRKHPHQRLFPECDTYPSNACCNPTERKQAMTLAAMEPTDAVAVQRLEDGDIAFVPGDPRAGIVFYPGGKVQAEAYAPLMRDLADRGLLCVIVCMPSNLAVLDANGADGVQGRFPAVRRWILMGRSLGPIPPPTSPMTASRC